MTRRLHVASGRWKLGLAYTLATTALWSTLPIALKIVLTRMDALSFVWCRFTVAALLLLALPGLRRSLTGFPPFRGASLALIAVALTGFTGNNVVFLLGLERIGPTAAQVLIQAAPLMMVFGGAAVFRERLGAMQLAGVALLLGGFAAFFHDRLGELTARDSDFAAGAALILLAAAMWTGFALAQKQLLLAYRSLVVMALVYSAGSLMLLPWARPAQAAAFDGVETAAFVYCCLTTVLGYGFFVEALQHWEASRVGAVIASTPVFTAILAIFAAAALPNYVQSEGLDPLAWAGAAAVAGGSAAGAIRPRRAARGANHSFQR